MRFSLRTLLIIMLLAGPLGAWGWKEWRAYRARLAQAEASKTNFGKAGVVVNPFSGTMVWADPAAADQIWQEQRDRITWESFPESQPSRP
jgi:hypothetical protein